MEVDSELIVGLKINSVFNTKLLKDWGPFCPIQIYEAAGESSIREPAALSIWFGFCQSFLIMFFKPFNSRPNCIACLVQQRCSI